MPSVDAITLPTTPTRASAIGPFVGGLLLAHFWWGSVFLIGVPVMVLLLIVGPLLLPEFRDPDARRIDLSSAAMSLAAVLLVVYGVKQMAQGEHGWVPSASVAGGLTVGLLFLRRQLSLSDPLVDLRLFRVRAFSVALGTYTIATFIVFGMYLFVGQYLQLVRGLSAFQAGLCMLPMFSAFIVGSMCTPALTRGIRPATLMSAGLGLAIIGFLLLTRAGSESGLVAVVIGCTVFSLGTAPVFTLTTDLIVGAAPPERAGVAAALSETGSELGGALGIAVLSSVGAAVYRGAIGRALSAGVLPEAATAARATLGGAIAAAERLPRPSGLALADVARAAFSHALGVVAVLCAVVAAVTALAVLVILRSVVHPQPTAEGTA